MQKIGRYFYIIILIGLIGASGFFVYQKTRSPCDKPLEYSVGRFDSQFGISEEEFKTYIAEAGLVWEKALGRNIFTYKQGADFKINLIYDERQLATIQKQRTESGLLAAEDAFKKLDAELTVLKNEYDQKVSLHEQSLASFKNKESAYNAEIAAWNSKGGAPKNVFDSLETEKEYLNAEIKRINAQVADVNNMAKQLGLLIEERNTKVSEYNKVAEEYNKKYNEGLEFNQAEYKTGSSSAKTGEINVYQFGDKNALILALTHELGHALGMGHVENSKSIMYYISNINIETNLTPTTEDLAELNRVCK